MTESVTRLEGTLLIAMPTLADPNFWHSVVLIGVHSKDDGAFGLVVNRPLDIRIDEVLDEIGEPTPDGVYPRVLAGGPVEPHHGFVLYENEGIEPGEASLTVDGSIAVSGSTEVLAGFARGSMKGRYHLLLGYAGWHPGQLEREIEENSWLVAPLDTSIVFDVPIEDRWNAALKSIGVDPGTLVDMGSGDPS